MTAKRMSKSPISPGKIPGLSMNSPRMGIVKESQQTASPRNEGEPSDPEVTIHRLP